MQSETNRDGSLKTMVLTKSRHQDLYLIYANYGKEDGIDTLTTIEIAKAQKKITRSILKTRKNIKSGFVFQLIENKIVLYKDEN